MSDFKVGDEVWFLTYGGFGYCTTINVSHSKITGFIVLTSYPPQMRVITEIGEHCEDLIFRSKSELLLDILKRFEDI